MVEQELNSQQLEIYFQTKDKGLLSSQLSKFKEAKAPLLVSGYEGLPILQTAIYIAKNRLCLNPVSIEASGSAPCLECLSCRAIDRNESSQLKIIQPEGRFIKVDQIRDVIRLLSLRQEKQLIVIFDQVHKMNKQAANALLKTLEEPPENCWMMMTASSLKMVLSTLRSRSTIYKVRPLDFNQMSGGKDIGNDLNLLQGRWDRYLKKEEFLQTLSEVRTWVASVDKGSENSFLDWSNSREGFLELLTYLRYLLKENALRASDHKNWILTLEKLNELEDAYFKNVDLKLMQDHLMMALEESHVFH